MWVADEAAGRDPYAADAMHKKAKFALYKAYHDKKQRWDDGADAFRATALRGRRHVQGRFRRQKNDPKVQALVKAWADSTYDVAKIQGVPAFVVNGKYLLKTASIRSIDGSWKHPRLSKK